MKKYLGVLSKCILFDGMGGTQITNTLSYLKPKINIYKKGAYVSLAGMPVYDAHIVLEGCVQAALEDASGVRSLLGQYTAGASLLGRFASIKLQKSPVCTYASMPTTTLSFPFENINKIPVALQARILNQFCVIFAHNALRAIAQFEHLSKLHTREKIWSYFLAKKEQAGNSEFVIPISKMALAEFLLISRSALTRELAALRKEKMITFSGRKFRINAVES